MRPPRLLALATVIVMCLGVTLTGCTTPVESAEDVVRRYLTLIADGKGDEATRMVPVRLDGPEDKDVIVRPEYLSDRMLKAATTRLTIDKIEVGSHLSEAEPGATSTANVTYSVGSRSSTEVLEIRRDPDRWTITTPLVDLESVHTDLDTVGPLRIGGIAVPTTPAGGTKAKDFAMYPGVYPVTGQSSRYWTSTPTTTADPAGRVSFEPTQLLKQTVIAGMKKHFDRCMQLRQRLPQGCPDVFSEEYADKIVTYPKLVSIGIPQGKAFLADFGLGSVESSDKEISQRFHGTATITPRSTGTVSIGYSGGR